MPSSQQRYNSVQTPTVVSKELRMVSSHFNLATITSQSLGDMASPIPSTNYLCFRTQLLPLQRLQASRWKSRVVFEPLLECKVFKHSITSHSAWVNVCIQWVCLKGNDFRLHPEGWIRINEKGDMNGKFPRGNNSLEFQSWNWGSHSPNYLRLNYQQKGHSTTPTDVALPHTHLFVKDLSVAAPSSLPWPSAKEEVESSAHP